ncbi:alanine-zipper protein [Marinivivus vitaminiproducens]|uniref:alanine-zipper protein n=1 Tax=Marinivivus vitaminiproducens TaxID=3035935 RepID=UPI00279B2EE8|nr:alanine-zipper protein [Geminicoccaceae bacterium SCSIO 64248]
MLTVLLAGCASGNDIGQLREELAQVRIIAEEALRRAESAEAQASEAEEDAETAGAKADRVFEQALRQ